jgi:pimeloyl-ACP methyl ester carboxylesterase
VQDNRPENLDEAFIAAMKTPWNSEEGGHVAGARHGVDNHEPHDRGRPRDVMADTLLLWRLEDEFQPVQCAERLKSDIVSYELVGLEESNHRVPADRPGTFRDHLVRSLLD